MMVLVVLRIKLGNDRMTLAVLKFVQSCSFNALNIVLNRNLFEIYLGFLNWCYTMNI